MHGDGKSSVNGFFKGWLMHGGDGKYHVQIREKKNNVIVAYKAFSQEPKFSDVASWLKGVTL